MWVQCSIYDVDDGAEVLKKNPMLGLAAAVAVAVVAVADVVAAVAVVVDPEHQIEMPHKSIFHFLYIFSFPSSSTLQGMLCHTS